jgi:hypothetical protein
MNAPWYKDALMGVSAKPTWALTGALKRCLDAIIAQEQEPVLAYSRSVALVVSARRAAVFPPHNAVTRHPPAGDDKRVLPPNHPWMPVLAFCFEGALPRLQREIFQHLLCHKCTLPYPLLLPALRLGLQSEVMRHYLLPILGTRGRWLAALNPLWTYAVGVDEISVEKDDPSQDIWELGAFSQRLGYLQRIREQDPAQARELLSASLGELPAKERLAFIKLFGTGLEADDEVLLERLLKDRSQHVRKSASILLARLPETKHAQQLNTWLSELITCHQDVVSNHWTCDAPKQVDDQWKKAGVNLQRSSHETLGERAWWLYQLVSLMPLRWWRTHTGMSPSQLIVWAQQTDWRNALMRGWREQAGNEGDIEWVIALLDAGQTLPKGDQMNKVSDCDPAHYELYLPTSLDVLFNKSTTHHILSRTIASYPLERKLSKEYSSKFLQSLTQAITLDKVHLNKTQREQLVEFITLLDLKSLKNWQVSSEIIQSKEQAEIISDFKRIIETRHIMQSNPL